MNENGKPLEVKVTSKPCIVVYVRNETFWQSLLNDVTSIVVLCGSVVVNELTIQSPTLNSLLGMLGVIALIGWAISKSSDQRIHATDPDEVIERLRKKLKEQIE